MADFTILWIYFAVSLVVSAGLFIAHWAMTQRSLKKNDADRFNKENTLSLILIGAYTARWSEH